MTDFPDDRARFESVPYLEADAGEAELPEAIQVDTWIETRQVDGVPPEPYVVDDFFEEEELTIDGVPAQYEEVELSVRHRESLLDRFLRQRKERRQQVESNDGLYLEESEPAAIAAGVTDSYAQEASEWRPESTMVRDRYVAPEGEMPYADSPMTRRAPMTNPETTGFQLGRQAEDRVATPQLAADDDDLVIPPPLPEYDPARYQSAQTFDTRHRARPEPERGGTRAASAPRVQQGPDEFGDQPLFASHPLAVAEDVEIAPGYARPESAAHVSQRVERFCQTCRDFRPSDDGERGWCNNKWAFNHRRMVDADDLACRNSLGSWWTPRDESWRRDGDISRHAQQTPRVDQWLLGNREHEADRRKSGS
jgi:hypothetical protein